MPDDDDIPMTNDNQSIVDIVNAGPGHIIGCDFGDSDMTIIHSSTTPILIIKQDGTKLHGVEQKPLADCTREELLALIDDLCNMMLYR